MAALKKAGVDTVDIPVRDLDDTLMAKIMAHENMDEWAHNALIEQETLRSIVMGYAEGRIKLPSVNRKKIREAICGTLRHSSLEQLRHVTKLPIPSKR
jgi:hypothetical protein